MNQKTVKILQIMTAEPPWSPLTVEPWLKSPCSAERSEPPVFDDSGITPRISSTWLIAQCCDYDAGETTRINTLRKRLGDCRPADLMLSFCRSNDRDARAGHTLLEGDILTHAIDYVLYAEDRVAISLNVGVSADVGYSWPRVFRVQEAFLPIDSRQYGIACDGGGHSWMWNGRVWNNPVHGPLEAMEFVAVRAIPSAALITTHPDLFRGDDTPVVAGDPSLLKLRYIPEGTGYCPLCGRELSKYITPKRKDH